jgi:hypothetical protein
MKKACPLCGTEKQKRRCRLAENAFLCIACCEQKQDLPCTGCPHYPDADRLFFHCRTCGKDGPSEVPSLLAEHLHVAFYPVPELDGPLSQTGSALCGESYRTVLEFPFDSRTDAPFWLLVHRDFELSSMYLIEGELLEVLERDRHQARVEFLALQVASIADLPRIFSGRPFTGAPPPARDLFPGRLSIETEGAHTIWRSSCQDGGAWMVFTETASGPALTLYAQGWFSHWIWLAGHLRLERDLYDRLREEGSR